MKKLLVLLVAVVAVVAFAADEVKVSGRVKVDNGFLKFDRNTTSLAVDQATAKFDSGSKTLTTATNGLPIVNTTSAGYMYLRNLSTNGGTRLRMVVTLELRGGEIAVFPAANTNMTAYTTNSTAVLDYMLLSR